MPTPNMILNNFFQHSNVLKNHQHSLIDKSEKISFVESTFYDLLSFEVKASAEIIFVGTVLTSGGSLIERGNLSFVSIHLRPFSMKGKRGKSVL